MPASTDTSAVVLLHGLGRSAQDWDGVKEALGRYGDVRAVDLPRGGMAALMSATADLPDRAILIGHSMAGVVALEHAARTPERVAGVILSDSFFPPSRNGRGALASARDYGAHRLAIARQLAQGRSRMRPSGGGARGLRSLLLMAVRPSTFHATAGAVRAPVLVVHARDDHHVPVDFAVAAAARHPRWTVRLLATGGHNVHAERPVDWLAATRGWLEHLVV